MSFKPHPWSRSVGFSYLMPRTKGGLGVIIYLIDGDIALLKHWRDAFPELYAWAKDPDARAYLTAHGLWLKAPWIGVVGGI